MAVDIFSMLDKILKGKGNQKIKTKKQIEILWYYAYRPLWEQILDHKKYSRI